MSSENYHRNHYEQSRGGDGDSHQESLRKKVLTGMRAVLQNYISREEAGTGSGMGKFDTLIHDRIVEWRIWERNRKIAKFTFYFFLSFFVLPIMLMMGVLDSWGELASFAGGVFLFGWVTQFGKTIAIKGHAATDTKAGKEGVKKAIADIWFETILSVKLSYIYAGVLILSWLALWVVFPVDLSSAVIMWFNFILNFFGLEISGIDPDYLVIVIFTVNLAALLGDYLYWAILYPRKVDLEDE